jgi:hypothetical protein
MAVGRLTCGMNAIGVVQHVGAMFALEILALTQCLPYRCGRAQRKSK